MTRGLRRLHRVAWVILAAALAVGYALALAVRPGESSPVSEPPDRPLTAGALAGNSR